uniref:Late endosomal/lysosomal adaptor and MAPK and MTOR activator 4 n=1 Tax=Trichuris muris TaxID=70415 RepID=A0A5S6R664_TRIMR
MYSSQNPASFAYLSKVPNQLGYLVLNEEGAILTSSGDLLYDQSTAAYVHRMVQVPVSNILPSESPTRMLVHFDGFFYSVVSSNKKVFVVKIRSAPTGDEGDSH